MTELPTLNLHCGYHKTGSSYLQSILAANRAFLQAHGVFYPAHASDHRAARGQATAGNGQEFALALREMNEAKVAATVQQLAEDCRAGSAQMALMSAEALFHTFGLRPEALHLLSAHARQSGFERTRLLLFVREPAAHALSVYRHRAKGKYLDHPEEWVESGYETLNLMGNFLDELQSVEGLDCTMRRYGDQQILNSAFFEDWLQVPVPPAKPNGRVRESLRLSEVLAIQAMEQVHPGSALDLAVALQALEATERADDVDLLQATTCRVARRMNKWSDQISRIDDRLPSSDRLLSEWVCMRDSGEESPLEAGTMFLTEKQLMCLQSALARHSSWLARFRRLARRRLPIAWIRKSIPR